MDTLQARLCVVVLPCTCTQKDREDFRPKLVFSFPYLLPDKKSLFFFFLFFLPRFAVVSQDFLAPLSFYCLSLPQEARAT